MKFRIILSFLLKLLSKWAIKKHNIKIAAVVGSTGTKLTAEMFGEMLSKDHVVRKQLESPFWDYSIPLSILGIDDKRYTVLGWFDVILRVIKVFLFDKSSPGWVVIQMNSLKEEIIDYWIDIVDPEISIILNSDPNIFPIESKVINKSQKVVIVGDYNIKKHNRHILTVGTNKSLDIRVQNFIQDKHGSKFILIYRGKKYKFIAAQTGIFMKTPIIAALSALIVMGKSMEDIYERLMKVEISIERFIYE